MPSLSLVTVVETTIDQFMDQLSAAAPRVLAGVVFLMAAVLVMKGVVTVIRWVLRRSLQGQEVYQKFAVTVISLFLWFAVLLAFLSIVGLNQIAAALGTATGFLALGVSYALSGMLADAVAGVYLLRDPDFNTGDTVTAGDMTGEIDAIELRKTRFDVDGDIVVRANADVEKRWTRRTAER